MASRPNVILILVDDRGCSDLGLTGSEVRTPNLDRLAADGALLSAMYNCARCCPTRASLLTGLYPHNAGIGHMGTLHPDVLASFEIAYPISGLELTIEPFVHLRT